MYEHQDPEDIETTEATEAAEESGPDTAEESAE